ncbi:MAG TPA: formate dehydrogenase accessory protein FdhE, partial [Terriglobales bacterium]
MRFSWDRRIQRASELAMKHRESSELLNFYQQLARFQKQIYEGLPSATEHDLGVLLPHFSGLVELVRSTGSPALKRAAVALAEDSDNDRLALLEGIWQHQLESQALAGEYPFFAQALLQPYAEYLADKTNSSSNGTPSSCPFCGSRPVVAVLRPEGDGGKRSLVCSLCSTEWNFRRVLCPSCGEENKDHLPIFAAEEFEYVRVDACDTCRCYIKSIDMTKNGNAVPVVDELATISLNLWAG